MRSQFSFLFLAASLLSGVAQARDPAGLLGIGGEAGLGIPLSGALNEGAYTAFVPGAHIRYHLTSNVAVQGSYRFQNFMETSQDAHIGDLAVQYWVSPRAKVSPVLGLGIGISSVSDAIERDPDFVNFSVSPSLGLAGWVSDCMTLGLGVRYHGILANAPDDGEVHTIEPNLNFTIYLGGKSSGGVASQPTSLESTIVDGGGAVTEAAPLSVAFEFESARLDRESKDELANLARFAKENDDTKVIIEGHADALGPATFNQELSKRRAAAVADFLIKNNGVNPEQVEAQGFGETRPIASNRTERGRQLNRRVFVTTN